VSLSLILITVALSLKATHTGSAQDVRPPDADAIRQDLDAVLHELDRWTN
jgi:hypothetical protein